MAILQATTISGSMLLTGSLQRVNHSIAIDGNYTASIDLSESDNFIFDASGSYALEFVAPTASIGQSGTIIINNTADTNPGSMSSNTKTPDGANIVFVTSSATLSIISYYIADNDSVLVNYIGNFA
jgi:hypothetical protein